MSLDLIASTGGDQFDFVSSHGPITRTASIAAGTQTANSASLILVRVGRPITITSLTIYIGTASCIVDVGIFTRSGTTYTLVASSGSTAAAGTNATQTIALTAAYTLQPGIDYYFAEVADNGTVTIGRSSAVAATVPAIGVENGIKASLFPLATFTTITTSQICPLIIGT